MKLKRDSILICSLLFSLSTFFLEPSSNTFNEEIKFEDSTEKEIRALLSKMKYIEPDSFMMGENSLSDPLLTESDTFLLTGFFRRKVAVDGYYIGVTEITNEEYRKFYDSKLLELGLSGSKEFFPDMTKWETEWPYSYNTPMKKHYFTHPRFNDFPVVGITWDQATSYCKWKSEKLKALLEKKGIKSKAEFRLPTEIEWEFAAIKKEDKSNETNKVRYYLPMNCEMKEINSLGNIGKIVDRNNLVVRSHLEDGHLYTCKVASHRPNDKGIYNMFGNVSEWTNDQGYIDIYDLTNLELHTLTTNLNDIDKQIELLENDALDLDIGLKEIYLKILTNNRRVLSKDDVKICKGGSWEDGMLYALPGNRLGIPKDHASTKLGFRVVISEVDETIQNYFPKKKWKPSNN